MTIAGCRHCIAASRVINGHGEAIHGEARAHCRGNRSWLVVAAECRASSHGRCGRATSRARGSEDRLHLTGAGPRDPDQTAGKRRCDRAARAARSGSRAAGVPAALAGGTEREEQQCDGLQPRDLDDPDRQLREPLAGSCDLPRRRLHPASLRRRPRRSQLQPGRIRADGRLQRRSVLLWERHGGDPGWQQHRHRGGVLQDACAQQWLHDQRGAVLLRYRLPERDPLAQLGLRGSTAGVPGVSWRPAGAGRCADPVARAGGLLHRAGSGGRQRPQLPRHSAQFELLGERRTVRAPGGRCGRFHQLAAGRVLARCPFH